MDYQYLFDSLESNKAVFENLLLNLKEDIYLWRPYPEHWCLLEIVCHLYDEEQEDFRTRTKVVLEHPGTAPPSINPGEWIKSRKYIDRNYDIMVHKFLDQREQSLTWLRSLENPQWDNFYEHPVLGKLSAHHFVSNWLAHDYLHIRQITRLKYNYLKQVSGDTLVYAGNW